MKVDELFEEIKKQIRGDERRLLARQLVEAIPKSGKNARQGLWLAATLIDPSVQDNY